MKIRRFDLPAQPHRDPIPPARFADLGLEIRGERIDLRTRGLVMAIVNRTPDSFFDRGAHFGLDDALARVDDVVAAGADIVDVGGVKAGPGDWVSPQEEIERVVPVIEAITERIDVPVSIDSFRSAVTAAALDVGASIINDISGLFDPRMIELAVASEAAVVVCHIQGRPRIPNPDPRYEDLRAEVLEYMRTRVERCRAAGIGDTRLILDAAFDFGKSEAQSFELFAHTHELTVLGLPVLVSASNKRYLGDLLGTDVTDRNDASLASVAFGMHQGARLFRVHDVVGTRRVVDTITALLETDLAIAGAP